MEEEIGSKDIFVNFVLGHIGKNERPKMREQIFLQKEEFVEASNFFIILKKKQEEIRLEEDGIVNVTYTYSNVETTREVEKKNDYME